MIAPARRWLSAGGRRFWVTVLCFAILNTGAWFAYHRAYVPMRRNMLRVESFLPGNDAVIGVRQAVSWRFNMPVVASDDGRPPGEVTPSVSGRWTWPDARTLSFVPDEDLPRATPLKLVLAAGALRSPEGFVMNGPFEAVVRVAPLAVVGVRQASFQEDDRFLIEIEFSDRVLPSDVLSKLVVRGPDRRLVRCDLHGQAVGNLVRVLTEPIPIHGANAQLTVRIEAGLTGLSGPLGMTQPYEWTLPLDQTLVATSLLARSPARGQPALCLRFNNTVSLEHLRQVISVEPAVPFAMESDWRGVMLRGAFIPGTRYSVRIAKRPPGADRRQFPRPDTLSAFVPDRRPGVWFEHSEGYLGSAGNRTLMAHAVNVREVAVRIHRVYDNNLVAWRTLGERYRWGDPTYFGQPLAMRTIRLDGARNVSQPLALDLEQLLGGDKLSDGVYRIALSATAAADPRRDDDFHWGDSVGLSASAVVSLSDIGLTAKQSRGSVLVWAVSLKTAQPLPDVRVRVYTNKNQLMGEALTNSDGLANVVSLDPPEGEAPAVVTAERRGQSSQSAGGLTWLDLRSGKWDMSEAEIGGRPYLRDGYEAFVYTERGVYRPGETVHLRAIVRGQDNQVPLPFPLRWQIRRPDLRNYLSQTVMLDADGAAAWSLQLPADLPTGRYSAELYLPGESNRSASLGSTSFQVEEFMPQRIRVQVWLGEQPSPQTASLRLRPAAQPLVAQAQADYLFGRPAAGLRAELNVSLEPAGFHPAAFAGWVFGDSARTIELPGHSAMGQIVPSPAAELALNDDGRGRWEISLGDLLKESTAADATEPAALASRPINSQYLGPWRLMVSASVHEPSGRAVVNWTEAAVDVLPYYVGLRRTTTGALRADSSFEYEVVLVGPDGALAEVDGDLDVDVLRESWNTSLVYSDGQYRYESTRVLNAADDAEAPSPLRVVSGRGSASLKVPTNGSYVLRLRDRRTGAMTSHAFYVSDGSPWDDNISRERPERLQIAILPVEGEAPAEQSDAPDTLRIGRRAQALVRSPFPGTLLLTVETDRVLSAQVLPMTASQLGVPIEITPEMRPNAYVTATVLREVRSDTPWRIHRAFGATRLRIDPAERRLNVAIEAPPHVLPRSTLDVAVRITSETGLPVRNAAVTLAAVDEGILQLTGFRTPDPLAFFTGQRALGVRSGDLYSQLMPEVPKPQGVSAVGGDIEGVSSRYRTPVAARRVRPVSLISQVLHTDDSGVARTEFAVPEFTGGLRIMAVTHAGQMFGSAERSAVVRSPLLVQSSLPRFAAPGDRFHVPLVIFNNTDAPGDVQLRVELLGGGPMQTSTGAAAGGPLVFSSTSASTLEPPALHVPAGGQAVTAFEMTALPAVGVARIRILATMGAERFEENIELPVRPASPMISRGGYAAVTPQQPLKLQIPGGMLAGTQSLNISVTAWPTLELPTGLEYLERYPYGCMEQTVSTCFPLIYLSDIGQRIAPGVFERQRVAYKVQSGIHRLIAAQTADGGLGAWPGSGQSWPWASVYAAHFIVEAEAAGHPVPDDFSRHLLAYVRKLLDRADDDGNLLETQAYACYVLALTGKAPRTAIARLMELTNESASAAPSEYAPQRQQTRFLLALAQLHAGRRDLADSLLPAAPPLPRQTRQLDGNLGSPVRDRALAVLAMLSIKPDHPALPALVQQLADVGRDRRWLSTQDAAFAVMAIGRYLRQLEGAAAYDTAELSSATRTLAAVADGSALVYSVGAGEAAALMDQPLQLRIAGPATARGHVTWLQSGVPLGAPENADNGLKIRRRYLREDGSLIGASVRSGDLLRVELSIEGAPNTRNIAIEDLLPAGLEIENPRLISAASDPQAGARGGPAIFSGARLDMRDDRLLLFGDMPGTSVAQYVYSVRAVTAGTFVVPPVRAECMYDIGTCSLWTDGRPLVVEPMQPAVAGR